LIPVSGFIEISYDINLKYKLPSRFHRICMKV